MIDAKHEELVRFMTAVIKARVLLADYPILDDDRRIKGVLSASLDLIWLTGLADEMHFPAAVKLIVFDRGGTIWLQYPAAVSRARAICSPGR